MRNADSAPLSIPPLPDGALDVSSWWPRTVTNADLGGARSSPLSRSGWSGRAKQPEPWGFVELCECVGGSEAGFRPPSDVSGDVEEAAQGFADDVAGRGLVGGGACFDRSA